MSRIRFAKVIFVTFLLFSVFVLQSVQPVKANPDIIINADGTITQSGNLLQIYSNVSNLITYVFTGNITDHISISRGNIVINGKGNALVGAGSGDGLALGDGVNHVTIGNLTITSFDIAIRNQGGSVNQYLYVKNVTIQNCNRGVFLLGEHSGYATITNNSFVGDGEGIFDYTGAGNNIISQNIINASSNCIEINAAGSNTISGNIMNCNGNGISMTNDVRNTIISGNSISVGQVGIAATYGINDTIISGNIFSCNIAGISVGGNENGWSSNITVTRNNVYAATNPTVMFTYVKNSVISQNTLTTWSSSIINFDHSNYNSISDNNLTSTKSTGYCISLYFSNFTGVTNNKMYSSTPDQTNAIGIGIAVTYGYYNSMIGNTITNPNSFGFKLDIANYNTVSGNTILMKFNGASPTGIWFTEGASYNNVRNNIIDGRHDVNGSTYGIQINTGANNIISENTIVNNNNGLYFNDYLFATTNNTIVGNTIQSNAVGAEIVTSSWNYFYNNNFINNGLQVQTNYYGTPAPNYWNGSFAQGGNYWSNYVGTDGNHDGIGDTPYVIDSSNVDNYPLMAPWTPKLGLEKVTVWYWNSGSVVNSVATGDVDVDSSAEVVTAGYYFDGTMNVAQLCVWNGPDGAFKRVTAWYWTGNTTINSVAVGDVDNDGKIEIVTGGYYFDGVRNVAQLLVWNGATLAVEGVKTWYWVGDTKINSIALGDVDADGQVEIVTAGTYVDSGKTIAQLAEWAGNGLALDRITVWVTGGTSCMLNSVALGDVDADGQVEVVTGGSFFDGSRNVAELKVWSGVSLVLEQNKPWFWVGNTTVSSVAVGDVDGDGLVEVVTGGYYYDGSRNIAQVIEWVGSGLAAERLTVWSWLSGTVLNSVALGDVDGDGQVEVVTGGYYFDGTRNIAQLAVCNGSDLAFENIKSWYWVGSTTINSVVAGDVNGDFLKEIVTGGAYYDGTRWISQFTVWGMT